MTTFSRADHRSRMHRHRWKENRLVSAMMDTGYAYDCSCGAQRHIYDDGETTTTEIIEPEPEYT